MRSVKGLPCARQTSPTIPRVPRCGFLLRSCQFGFLYSLPTGFLLRSCKFGFLYSLPAGFLRCCECGFLYSFPAGFLRCCESGFLYSLQSSWNSDHISLCTKDLLRERESTSGKKRLTGGWEPTRLIGRRTEKEKWFIVIMKIYSLDIALHGILSICF